MMYLLLVAAVLIARFQLLPSGLNPESRINRWGRYIANHPGLGTFGKNRAVLAVALPVVLLVLVLLICLAFNWHLLIYVITFPVLVLCFNTADLKTELNTYVDDLRREDTQAAYHDASQLNSTGDESSAESWVDLHKETFAEVCLRYYQRYFPVIFWFVALGIAGALLYRIIQVLLNTSAAGEHSGLRRLSYVLDWVPARLFGLSLAVVGNFKPVMMELRHSIADCTRSTAGQVQRLAGAAIHDETSLRGKDAPSREIYELEELPGLIDRSLILWIAVCGLVAVF